jgi:hypothetical protein
LPPLILPVDSITKFVPENIELAESVKPPMVPEVEVIVPVKEPLVAVIVPVMFALVAVNCPKALTENAGLPTVGTLIAVPVIEPPERIPPVTSTVPVDALIARVALPLV